MNDIYEKYNTVINISFMTIERLQKLLDDIRSVSIAVIGDFCLDAYWFIDKSKSEISIETSQATHPVAHQRYTLGGAGNVASNLASLGVNKVLALGVIGNDPFGTEMVRIMKETGINTENLLIQPDNWSTHTYAKPYIGENELNRVDFGNFNSLEKVTADRLIGNLIESVSISDIVIINQQVPSGIHTDYFKKRLVAVIREFPEKPFIADSRNFNDFYTGSLRKMNDTEALRLCGKIRKPDEIISLEELKQSANELYLRYSKPVFITRGARGSLTVDETGITEIPGLLILSKVDTVGAGDSYLAGTASAMAAGYNIVDAARLGTFVAGVTVQKLFQTGTATPKEIFDIGNDPDYIFLPELAEDIRHASYIDNTEIEIISNWKENPEIRHAIFDHDGTISTLREGWELIMAPMMIKAILGDNFLLADDALYRRIQIRVQEFIDKTTGIQTLVQMHGLRDMIIEFGFVDEEKILDATGYKKIFNDELLLMVRSREKKFKDGELTLDDFTLKNSVPFLRKLYDSGVKLYLASGTDIEDVISEAKALGYDNFFEGRIFGSVGDISRDAKKIVLDQILDTIGDSASARVVTFGDGPVEIRETRKRGGLTVGVASNEVRRYGLNLQKRTRLIKAGADIIVPDFSQYTHLLELLNL
ncbi:MAG TPA: carbohydrate kinase [Bacteroidales bacterium]|nr:carbohydrate kinase [Bacteroidales bacterium]HBQ84788.1 carbohydrate kinase [Bacteroidales bacterium]HCU18186.1 carbohydrate kinase [Bacteroidales bacterium]